MKNQVEKLVNSLINQNQAFDLMQDLNLAVTDVDTNQERYINLKIQLDSWSPIYTSNGVRYREKLSPNCFDSSTRIEDQELYSYVDHIISIENMIGATADNSMKVTRDGDSIIAKIKVNENDYLSKKTANLIESGAIKSNSFIFKPTKINYNYYEKGQNNDVDFEMIFESGELISIDPVYKGFYTQNDMSIATKVLRSFDQNNIEDFIEEEKPMVEKELVVEETLEEKSVSTDEQEVIETANEVETVEEVEEVEEKEIKEVVEARKEPANNANTFKNVVKNAESNLLVTKSVDYNDLQNKYLSYKPLTTAEKNYLLKNMIDDSMSFDLKRNIMLDLNVASFEDAKALLQKRAGLDGTSNLNGLALIEILQNKRVLTEWMKIFPELTTYAQVIPLVGYNKIEQSISIADKTKARKLTEGEDAQAYNPGTTKVTLSADRYSELITQSNQLNMFDAMINIATKDVKNNIIDALREDFFTNLFAKVGEALNTDAYEGGATKESIVYTQEVGKFSFKDLNNIAVKLIEKYGTQALDKYFISMSSDVYNHLLDEYFGSGNILWKGIFEEDSMKFRGIQIVLSDKIPDKTIAAGKNIVAFLTKDSIIAYGCITIVKDDPYGGLAKDQMRRVVQLRGRVRMCDPNINTIIVQVRANASQVSAKALNQTPREAAAANRE